MRQLCFLKLKQSAGLLHVHRMDRGRRYYAVNTWPGYGATDTPCGRGCVRASELTQRTTQGTDIPKYISSVASSVFVDIHQNENQRRLNLSRTFLCLLRAIQNIRRRTAYAFAPLCPSPIYVCACCMSVSMFRVCVARGCVFNVCVRVRES